MPNPRQARRIVRDRQPDRPGRMWFKPYYGIEAERVGRDRGLCASAILSPEVCYLREAIGDFARWASRFVAGLPRSSKAPWGRLQSEGTSICECIGSYKDQGWKMKASRGQVIFYPCLSRVEVGRARITPIKAVRIIVAPTLLPSPLLLLIAAASAKPARA